MHVYACVPFSRHMCLCTLVVPGFATPAHAAAVGTLIAFVAVSGVWLTPAVHVSGPPEGVVTDLQFYCHSGVLVGPVMFLRSAWPMAYVQGTSLPRLASCAGMVCSPSHGPARHDPCIMSCLVLFGGMDAVLHNAGYDLECQRHKLCNLTE
jgi:hypothetical protein